MSGRKLGSLHSDASRRASRYDDMDPEVDDFDEIDVDEYVNNPDADDDFELSPIKNPVINLSTEWKARFSALFFGEHAQLDSHVTCF